MRKLFIEVIALAASLSCVNPYIGKQVQGNWSCGALLKENGHHRLEYEHLIIQFDYTINRTDSTITCDGILSHKEKGHRGVRIVDMHINVLFLDPHRIVVASKDFFLPDHSAWEKVPFRKTFHYDSQYSYITFQYTAKYY